ncbi:hypothetical protein BEN78_16510 [Xanthomonas citri pv. mangiferaeindicae]|nr:hypothetical protein BEN78_16510 [Xanthomonas citri pv. mangiferaeindicae]
MGQKDLYAERWLVDDSQTTELIGDFRDESAFEIGDYFQLGESSFCLRRRYAMVLRVRRHDRI